MCVMSKPRMPKAPEPLPERQPMKAPSNAAILTNTTERTKRRLGYANLQYTPIAALAPPATAGKTLLGI
jgi:hypothetical protein